MSRTYRRKNYETVCQNSYWGGSKLAGFYTEVDWVPLDLNRGWLGHVYTYRAPTKAERFKRWYSAHGESRHANHRTPGPAYREHRMRQNRSINKEELHRCLREVEYEPLFEANPRDCWWDWI